MTGEQPAPPPDLSPFDRLAQASLPRWGLPPGARARRVNHSENITYLVDGPDGAPCAALRLHRPGYHSDAAILSELAWLDALRDTAGVAAPSPLPGLDGAALQVLHSPELPAPRRAVLFGFLAGREPEGDLGPAFEQLGEVTARLHRHARHWRPPAGFTRFAWDFDAMLGGPRPIWGRWQDGLGVAGSAAALLRRLCDTLERRLAAFGSGPERRGLIHADLRLANLLVDAGRVKVIDFDDCGDGWFLYDYGTSLSFIENRTDVPELTEAWLRGYRRVGAVSAAEEAELPTFLLLRRLMLVAWLGSHRDTDLARALGAPYTLASCDLAESYLGRYG